MKLVVEFGEKANCYASLHSNDAAELFRSSSRREFCKTLRLQHAAGDVFVGWVGENSLTPGKLVLSKPFAECLALEEGEQVDAFPHAPPIASTVMVQPNSIDDWEVVELQASFIEENLLSQVAVLMPGLSFPVWVHGQLVAKLRVDPVDSNKSSCFLLGRDTELAIESKRRTAEAASIIGGAVKTDEIVSFRVLCLDEESQTPIGRVAEEDLDDFCGGGSRSCLAWLLHDDAAVAQDRRPGSSAAKAYLLRLLADVKVPRGHVALSASLATWVGIPCFSVVNLCYCYQVPVFMPHIELVPCHPGHWLNRALPGSAAREDVCWIRRRFEALVKACEEIDVADGSVLQLRAERQPTAVATQAEGHATSVRSSAGDSNLEADLYEGLSDIDDIYQRQAEPPIFVDTFGVYEVDLGIDIIDLSSQSESIFPAGAAAKERWASEENPEVVLVYIRLAAGAASDLRSGPDKPPFARITSSGLLAGEPRVTIAWDDGGSVRQDKDPLGVMWAAMPTAPPEEWADVMQIIKAPSTNSIDKTGLFSEPFATLHRHVEASLGCHLHMPATDALPSQCQMLPGIIAVVGPPGSGKSRLCHRVLGDLAAQGVLPVQVACSKFGPGKKFKAVQDWLRSILSFACWYSPCVLLLDDFGALCPDVEPGAPNLSVSEERSPILAEMILDILPEVRSSGARVACVATMHDDASVHRMLWSWPALEHKVPIRQPVLKERPDILQALCNHKAEDGWEVEQALLAEGALDDWAGRIDGFSVADLASVVERACIEATVDSTADRLRGDMWGDRQRMSMQHLAKACEEFVPATMADQTFFTSDVRLEDIGGLTDVKQELMDMLTMPTRYAVLLDRAPVRTRKGLMLVGPPGCGKTMLIQAAASETKGLLRFLSVKGPELLSKYIGESEAGVRKVFERAAAAAPAVIFFDEIEALTPKRGADSTGVTDRVVNQMLCYLDGVEDRGRVFVVAATGRPDMVDPALMRPGRFDKICYCGLPSDSERLAICEILARKNNLTIDQVDGQSRSSLTAHLQQLVSKLPRLFTSADINALFSSAKIEAVNEALEQEGAVQSKQPSMRLGHLFSALETAKASVSEADEKRYSQIFGPYCPGGTGRRVGIGEEVKAVKGSMSFDAGRVVLMAVVAAACLCTVAADLSTEETWTAELRVHLETAWQISAEVYLEDSTSSPGVSTRQNPAKNLAETNVLTGKNRTQGRWIVDATGNRVKLACVNWAGAEVKDGLVGGLQARNVSSIAATFKSMGFNCVRFPWSVWMVQTNPRVPDHLQKSLLGANPQLMGLRALEVLDAVIDACASTQLLVFLDNHVSDGTWCCSDVDENGLWYNSRWPTSDWLEAHVKLATRYVRQPWVVGTELRNEVRASAPRGTPHWGGGGPNDWHAAATKAGNAVLAVNPSLLVAVGGLNYGKDLSGVYRLPVQLDKPDKLVYTAHSYSWSYPWLTDTYQALHEQLGKDWGFIVEENKPYTAPIWVSEFGTFSDCHKDSCANWWPDFLRYLQLGDLDWAVWHGDGTWSRDDLHPFHGPTNYGVLAADWQTPAASGELLAALQTVQAAWSGPGVSSMATQCNAHCADSWDSGWSNGRENAAACAPCLRNRPCRGNLTVQEWCNNGWAKVSCSWTCCRAGLLNPKTCEESRCQSRYSDDYNPSWPSGVVNTSACLNCLQDKHCRGFKSRSSWCGSPWAAAHCQLTCCTAGFLSPSKESAALFLQ
ncbi:PEX1 [Symbiodinium natans]|uniref:Peroxisomal ATPase PEX1 n=1 Tax=Symbiodinium natans TaxID=878477 RepID=A0A812RDA1_9DINO|nr:PEX1 [Symbiodinium natans]